MEYVINPGQPHVLSQEELIRPYVLGRFVNPAIPELTLKQIRAVGPGREFGMFRIHPGRYKLDPEDNARRVEVYGIPVVATLDGEKIGCATATSLWVHPAFRGKELAIEMMIDRMRYTGVESFLRFHKTREAAGEKMRYTQEGLETLKAAYAAMVKRGLIVSEPLSPEQGDRT